MFSFVDSCKECIYGCDFDCIYCWARAKDKNGRQIIPTFNQRSLSIPPISNTLVFLNSRSDMFCLYSKADWIHQIFNYIRRYPKTNFLIMTKNPYGYNAFRKEIPINIICGATIETNRDTSKFSKAPVALDRFIEMYNLIWPNKFISIEPVIDFDPEIFTRWLLSIKPIAIAIGYDNYNNHLPEPKRIEVEALIRTLENHGIKVFRKTIREKWN